MRPVRYSYKHVGKRPRHPTRPLTDEERKLYPDCEFVAFEPCEAPKIGCFWTEKDLNSGCGAVTTMAVAIAETYARDPGFYSGTFCVRCRDHFPVGVDGEFVWDGRESRHVTRRGVRLFDSVFVGLITLDDVTFIGVVTNRRPNLRIVVADVAMFVGAFGAASLLSPWPWWVAAAIAGAFIAAVEGFHAWLGE